MSSMLRSLRFVRRLNLGRPERRLCSALHREVLPVNTAAAARCLATASRDRNYVTGAAVKRDFTGYNLVDMKLNEIDRKVKYFANVYKKDIDDVLKIMQEKGQIKSSQALLLIRCCGEFLCSETMATRRSLVHDIWTILQKLEIKLDVSHYNALLLVNLENEVDFSPVQILAEMKDKGIEPNRVTFHRFVEQYCNKGDIAGATKILEHMNQQEIPINENIFNSLMKGHSVAGDAANALKLLDVMKQAGIEPSPCTYSTIMCTHAKSQDFNSILKVLNECKEKDILLADKEILEVIYSLALNNQSQHVDQLINIIPKGIMYNQKAIVIIHKLLEKGQEEVAYKLLKSLTSNKIDSAENKGFFFIRKLVSVGSDVEKVIKYCNILKNDKINLSSLEMALFAAYTVNRHHIALSLLKELKESGGEIREQYWYPILANYSNARDLTDLCDSLKIMINDFEIVPNISAVKNFIVPNLRDDYLQVANNLATHGLPFYITANAVVSHLLQNSNLQQALEFMESVHMRFDSKLLSRSLTNAFEQTQNAELFVDIVHHQYSKLLREKVNMSDTENENKEELQPVEFASDLITKASEKLSVDVVHIMEKVLQRLLEKGVNINEEAIIKIKEKFGPRLNPKSEEILTRLVSEDLTLADIKSTTRKRNNNIRDLHYLKKKSNESAEFKMLLIQEHCKMLNDVEVEKQLQELQQLNPTYSIGFCSSLCKYYSRKDDVVKTDEWYNRLHELFPDCQLNKYIILKYARCLVRNNRLTDALKVLEHPTNDDSLDRDRLISLLMKEVADMYPEKVEDFFNILRQNKYFTEINNKILGAFVKVHLDAGDVDKAVEKFEWCCETYKVPVYKKLVMKELIKREDAKTLQYVTHLVTRVQNEIEALHDLAIAFFECDRPRQARKILETPGLRLKIHKIVMAAERFSEFSEVERLENFVNLFKGLYLDMDLLHRLLLKSYEKEKNAEKCLILWTQMQEENIQPSTIFMAELDRILRKLGQPVPFSMSQSPPPTLEMTKNLHRALLEKDLEKADKIVKQLPDQEKPVHLLQLIQAYACESDISKAVQCMNELVDTTKTVDREYYEIFSHVLTQLVKKDDFSSILTFLTKIDKLSKEDKRTNRTFGYLGVVNQVYSESQQFAKYIDHLKEHLDEKQFNKTWINLLDITTAVKTLNQQPELENSLKEYALKVLKFKVYKPMVAIWLHQFLHNSPEAEKTWNEYLCETSHTFPTTVASVCIKEEAFDKIPVIMEKLTKQMNYFDQRKAFASVLRMLAAADFPQKYDIAFECLRLASKTVGLDKLNSSLVQQIKENVTNGQTIETLKTENERTKAEVTG